VEAAEGKPLTFLIETVGQGQKTARGKRSS
jgi:hypothetical protein